jgi:hypothetical protein
MYQYFLVHFYEAVACETKASAIDKVVSRETVGLQQNFRLPDRVVPR